MKRLCVYQEQASVLRVVIVVFATRNTLCMCWLCKPNLFDAMRYWCSCCTNRLILITGFSPLTTYCKYPSMFLIQTFKFM